MGLQRSEFDPITIVDNVTQPTESAAQHHTSGNAATFDADENEPVDITIDENDHKRVFGSQAPMPPVELPPRPATRSKTNANASTAQPPDTLKPPSSPPPDYFVTSQSAGGFGIPNEARHFLLPTALHESGLVFNPQLSLRRINLVPNDSPPGSNAQTAASTPTPIPSSEASVAPSATPTSGSEGVPAPSLAEIQSCKPHPEALFVAETLEWRLILDEQQMHRSPPLDLPLRDATHLYDACSLVPSSIPMYETVPNVIPVDEQRSPVQLLERWNADAPETPTPVLEGFNVHRCCVTGKTLISSPPDSIVSVLDRDLLTRFKENRESNPPPGHTGAQNFVGALQVLIRVIGNFVHGERRPAPTTSKSISRKLGWDQHSRQIFHDLGWKVFQMGDGRNAIMPPFSSEKSADGTSASQASKVSSTSGSSPHIIIQRHVRAWIELSAWLSFHLDQLRRSKTASFVPIAAEPQMPTKVLVTDASESVIQMIGVRQQYLDTSYRSDLSPTTLEAFSTLGASSTTRDELVKFSYLFNLEASPDRATELFACLVEVYSTQRRTSRVLEELIAYERRQGKYALQDVDKAYERLHLSATHLGPDVERESIPHDLIAENYKARAREVLINGDASEHAAVKDALKLITAHLGQPKLLVRTLEEGVDMDVDQAYTMLDANPELDDATILAVFDLYIADAPARRDVLQYALRAIAESRKSEYLRHFLRTGEKDASTGEGWQQLPSADVPAGIDNIGNTCYLNSVLQYFFSITEIRTRVLQAAATVQPSPSVESQLQSDAERRVGGQRITLRELQRSQRFVAQLAQLFHHLIHANALSVRPERELAYLALVSSRAEELEAKVNAIPEQALGGGGASEQNAVQQNAVFLSDPAPIEGSEDLSASDPAAEATAGNDLMDTTPDEPAETQPAVPPIPAAPSSGAAPPLPPRPTRKSTAAAELTPSVIPPSARRNSLMQLGAQQDVSECLDNCMFQLEVALAVSKAKASDEHEMDVDGNDEAKVSSDGREDLLTSLFLGKTCQQIEADTITPNSSHSSSAGAGDSLTRPAEPNKQPSTHIKHEVFKILPIDVLEEGRDIYDGFDGFFDSDTFVATSGAVQRRSVTLLSAPPLLQIQLQRVQYDRATMRAFKSQAHLEMPETLYVDRYMDLDPTDGDSASRIAKRLDYQAKRRRIEELRAKLAACKDGANFHLTQTLSQAANTVEELARLPSLADMAAQLNEIRAEGAQAQNTNDTVPLSPRSQAKQAATLAEETGASAQIESQSSVTANSTIPTASDQALPPALSTLIDPGLPTLLRDEAKLLHEQVQQAKDQIETLKAEMASIWADERRYAYRLVAVFMHRGEASHGHYFLNMRGGGQDSKWFKYNDSAVTETTLDQVLRDRSGATPYLVTYVREDYVQLIDPICRLIEEQQQQPGEQMEVEGPAAPADGTSASERKCAASQLETSTKQGHVGEAATAVKPSVVTEALQNAVGKEAGSGNESPIKRARTDDL
ncbi:related to UBP2-ubiquitin-specific proteinase [Ustilago bromivora]|uniref:ubiquitinyl hydrolase 1 n=1 Tax=Ustilago bromivora TaxID=307758 RepID=A0A1K0G4N4_9BASI|nr:related to UBP2-ubiquitin-specific proteinase [Ustilago bromivora]SYW79806.1 related to UBP2 - ubiquitin-specific proteinase [Ustilago bromivora]